MKRIPPSERMRKEQEGLLEKGRKGEKVLSAFLQKGMQLVMQEMLEAELTEVLQRGHYQRNEEVEASGVFQWTYGMSGAVDG